MIFPYKFSNLNNLYYIGESPKSLFFNKEEDYEKFIANNKNFFNFKEYSIKYCSRDVLITSSFMSNIQKIVKSFDINIKKIYSAPSLSLKIFDKKYNNNKVSIKYNTFLDDQIRDSYFGGRCEVYGNPYEEEKIYHFDFSGMYGSCMKEKFCFGKYKINKECIKVEKPGFYFIEYYSEMSIPVLPHHRINDKKLVFTNGNLKGIYWYEEIILFIKKGGIIKKIHYSIEFENYDYIFNDFVDFFNDIRNKGDDYKLFGKLMINSLYGRLGMNSIKNHSFFIEKKDLDLYVKNFKIISHVELNNYCLVNAEIDEKLKKKIKIKEKTKNNIALASAITSKARIKLYNAQQSVIANEGRILYSDTDSIFAAYKKDVINCKHGEINWDGTKEDTEIKKAVFLNPKTYAVIYKNGKEIIKMKGYNQNNIKYSYIEEKFYSDEKIEVDKYSYIKKADLNLKMLEQKKMFDLSKYDKRKFSSDKKQTYPLVYKNFQYM